MVARTVSRLARSSNESTGGSAKKAVRLHENYAGIATPNGCNQTRERQPVFTAAMKFICTKIKPLICYTGRCLEDMVYSSCWKVL